MSRTTAPVVFALAMLGMLGCPGLGGPGLHTGPEATVPARLDVLRGERPLQQGAEARVGEELKVRVQVDQPAYVHLFQRRPDGARVRLYPTSQEVARVEGSITIPVRPLDRPGRTDLLAVITAKPLEEVDLGISAVAQGTSTEWSAPIGGSLDGPSRGGKEEDKDPPPPPTTPGDRGRGRNGTQVFASTNKQVAQLNFWLLVR